VIHDAHATRLFAAHEDATRQHQVGDVIEADGSLDDW
jgi:hypothetical protein